MKSIKEIKMLLVALIFQLACGNALPQLAPPASCALPLKVIYINGINNDPINRWLNYAALLSAGPDTVGGNARKVIYQMLPNPTNGLVSDLIQSAKQAYKQQWNKYFNITDWLNYIVTDNILKIINVAPSDVVAEVYQSAAALKGQLEKDAILSYTNGTDLATMLVKLRSSYNGPASQTVLLGHSQGTLYINDLYDNLISDPGYNTRSLTTLGIADVASIFKNNIITTDQYISSKSDSIIKIVNAIPGKTTLGANYDGPFVPLINPYYDFLGHGLSETYLRHPGLRSAVVSTLKTTLETLNNACQAPIEVAATTFISGQNIAVNNDSFDPCAHALVYNAPPYFPAADMGEWNVTVSNGGNFILEVDYAAGASRPVDIYMNGLLAFSGALATNTGGFCATDVKTYSVGVVTLNTGMNLLRIQRNDVFPHLRTFRFVPQ